MIDLEENKRELLDLKSKFLSLKKTIGEEEVLEKKLKELEDKTLLDGFWNDSKTANVVLKEMKDVKNKYTCIVKIKKEIDNLIETNEFLCTENDEEMAIDLIKSTACLKKDIEKLELKMLLSGKFDKNNAIITLHPGARWNRITRLGSNVI